MVRSKIKLILPPHDGASVLACAYQLKVRSKNSKDFEHYFSQRLWVKFAMFLLNSTSVDACAIIGAIPSSIFKLTNLSNFGGADHFCYLNGTCFPNIRFFILFSSFFILAKSLAGIWFLCTFSLPLCKLLSK